MKTPGPAVRKALWRLFVPVPPAGYLSLELRRHVGRDPGRQRGTGHHLSRFPSKQYICTQIAKRNVQ